MKRSIGVLCFLICVIAAQAQEELPEINVLKGFQKDKK